MKPPPSSTSSTSSPAPSATKKHSLAAATVLDTRPSPSSMAALRAKFQAARQPGQPAKDCAEAIGCSEGAAIAAHVGAHTQALQATPLQGPWSDILQALQACGPVLALTRNNATVHEKIGVYENISVTGHTGLARGEAIDLRFFFRQWQAGFAASEPANDPAKPPKQSLQFFNAHGVAMHKAHLVSTSDRQAFDALVARFAQPAAAYAFTPAPAPAPRPSDTGLDAHGLAAAWARMKDSHEFFALTKKFGVERQQSFRLVEGQFTRQLGTDAVRRLLDEVAMDGTPIMVFVSSGGCIQIHSGPVHRIMPMASANAQWINVLDPGFNLHLREDLLAHAWAVEKPTVNGVLTSVEVFDSAGGLMAMFFGARKPGQPELLQWRRSVARLPSLETQP